MSRLLIAAMQSGSGKTTVTCGLLAAMRARGIDVHAFKCGPDYIDPMFHSKVLGIPSRNLDLFLQGEDGVRRTLGEQAGAVNILEGAMGFYDGVGGTEEGSGWQLAEITDTPVLLVVSPKGGSLTLAAQIKGLLDFRPQSHIVGILLNSCGELLYAHLAPILRRETGLAVLGYLPAMEEAELASRHLGLLTADEVADFSGRFGAIAAQLEKTVQVDDILRLADTAPIFSGNNRKATASQIRCRIAVARDEAFCFYYADNLDALAAAGAQLVYFSPITDGELPEDISGLYLGGGYPEVYAKALSENIPMRSSIRTAVQGGMPTVAECGGFLYLQKTLQNQAGTVYPMAGVLYGDGIKTNRLQRFGYLTLTAESDSMLLQRGECAPAHEFHYWDCTVNGENLIAEKPMNGKTWRCGTVGTSLYAAFPHLHFGGKLPLAERFVGAAEKFRGLSV